MSFLKHSRNNRFRDNKWRCQINVYHFFKIIYRHFAHWNTFYNTCIIYKDIDCSKLLFNFFYQFMNFFFFRYITQVSICCDSIFFVIFQCFLYMFFFSCIENYCCSCLRISFCYRISNSITTACYPGYFSF